MQESQPFDDAVIEVDEFRFGKAVDVNSHVRFPLGGSDAAQRWKSAARACARRLH
jgi:hypothetical protein